MTVFLLAARQVRWARRASVITVAEDDPAALFAQGAHTLEHGVIKLEAVRFELGRPPGTRHSFALLGCRPGSSFEF